MNTIRQIAERNRCDKDAYDHYWDVYWQLFGEQRGLVNRLLEIGVAGGNSLRAWRDFFPFAQIFGIDISPNAKQHESDRITIHIGDQADEAFLRGFAETTGGNFDIVIDDGGHYMDEQITSLETLWPYVRPGGFYVIEDLHTSYWAAYSDHGLTTVDVIKKWIDKLNNGETTVEYLKGWIDKLNNGNGELSRCPHPEPSDIASIGFWPSLCVIQKAET